MKKYKKTFDFSLKSIGSRIFSGRVGEQGLSTLLTNYPLILLHAKHTPLIKVPRGMQKRIAPEEDYTGSYV